MSYKVVVTKENEPQPPKECQAEMVLQEHDDINGRMVVAMLLVCPLPYGHTGNHIINPNTVDNLWVSIQWTNKYDDRTRRRVEIMGERY